MELNNIPSLWGWCFAPLAQLGAKTKSHANGPCACVGGKAPGKPPWMWDHLEAAVSTLLETAGVRPHLAVTLLSLAAGQGALPSGAGQGCPRSSPVATCRGDAAVIQRQAHMSTGGWFLHDRTSHEHGWLVSSRQNFCIIKLASSLPLSDTRWAFANAFFISLYTPPTSLWLNLLAHNKTYPATWRNLKIVIVSHRCFL